MRGTDDLLPEQVPRGRRKRKMRGRAQPYRGIDRPGGPTLTAMLRGAPVFLPNPADVQRQIARKGTPMASSPSPSYRGRRVPPSARMCGARSDPRGAPSYAATATAVVAADASLTFDVPDGEYWAAAPLGPWRYVAFNAETALNGASPERVLLRPAGALADNFRRDDATSSAVTMASGTLRLAAIFLPAGLPVSAINAKSAPPAPPASPIPTPRSMTPSSTSSASRPTTPPRGRPPPIARSRSRPSTRCPPTACISSG